MIVPHSIKRVTVATLSILASSSFHQSGTVHALKLGLNDQLDGGKTQQNQRVAASPEQVPASENSIDADAENLEGGLDPEEVAYAANTILDEDYSSGDPLVEEIVETGNEMLDI